MRPRLEPGLRPPTSRPERGVDLRAHVITTVVLVGTVAVIALLWAHPILLLYLFLAVVAVMAYAAVYLVVSARLAEDDDLEDGGSPTEAGTGAGAPPAPTNETEGRTDDAADHGAADEAGDTGAGGEGSPADPDR